MFNEKTVFILGAGASWHYGCPTGEDLVKLVKEKAVKLYSAWQPKIRYHDGSIPDYIEQLDKSDHSRGIRIFVNECNDLDKRLSEVNPLVIDYFLEQHPTLQNIGKLLISYIILDAENNHPKHIINLNRKRLLENDPDERVRASANFYGPAYYKDDWCRFLLDVILRGCSEQNPKIDLNKENLSIVTFNYDVTLENRFFKAIDPLELVPSDEKTDFYSGLVIHLYGSVRKNGFENNEFGQFDRTENKIVQNLNKAWEAAQTIYTIPEQKIMNKSQIDETKKKIQSADKIYILGYGFDSENSSLIGLKTVFDEARTKKIYFTNFQNSNRVNKQMGALLRDETIFLECTLHKSSSPRSKTFEKSMRNVYDALALDFHL